MSTILPGRKKAATGKTSRIAGPSGGAGSRAAQTGKTLAVRQARDIDERVGLAGALRWVMNYIFPDHWSFLLGEIALNSFLILVVTGTYLTFFFNDSMRDVVYHGSYVPLHGVTMSQAYASTIDISFSVKAGLVIRQAHHWAALIFVGAIGVHMSRVFFTGAFRKPRELNWTIGLGLLTIVLLEGFLGYSLPDDLLSGTGLRIFYSVFESIPFIGTWIAFFLFGGNFPGTGVLIQRMFVLHVFVVPALIAGLLGAHLALIMRAHHTQFKGHGATETNTVGTPLWPAQAAKSGGYFFILFGVILGLGGLAQINPIWLFGPYDPFRVSSFTQPDWYIGWMDGLLRLWPRWEVHFPGHIIANPFFPSLLIPGLLFTFLGLYPFLEAHFTGDLLHHNLLDRPRDRPVRLAIGAGLLTIFFISLLAGAEDEIAVIFSTSVQGVVWVLRIAFIVMPFIVGYVAYILARELSHVPDAGKRKRFNVVLRTAEGAYATVPSDPHPADTHIHLPPLPVEHAVPAEGELVPATTAPGPATSATSATSTTDASTIPRVRTVQREEDGEGRPGRGLRLGGLRRRPGSSAGPGGDGAGGNGAGGDGAGGNGAGGDGAR